MSELTQKVGPIYTEYRLAHRTFNKSVAEHLQSECGRTPTERARQNTNRESAAERCNRSRAAAERASNKKTAGSGDDDGSYDALALSQKAWSHFWRLSKIRARGQQLVKSDTIRKRVLKKSV